MGIIQQCWLYTGYLDRDGYGIRAIRIDGEKKARRVHRVAYEIIIGPIPKGLVIDHLCRVTNCYNPFHMEPVTPSENSLRIPKKTHCLRGHEFDEKNTRWKYGRRECRACDALRAGLKRATLPKLPPKPRVFIPVTECIHGHEYTPENTRIYKKTRMCRECERIRGRRRAQ